MYRDNLVFNPKKMKGFFCPQPWNTISVEADGYVYSCSCSFWTNLPIGNLLTEKLEDIFTKSYRMLDIRKSITDQEFSWCRENDCNEFGRLEKFEGDPFEKYDIDINATLPTNITLAIDQNCNLKCPSCRLEKYFSDRINPNVEKMLENFSQAYKDFDKPVMAMLDGTGDVFVSRSYQNFLFTDKLPKSWKLMILTNGNLLTKKKQEISSIRSQIDLITVSLDAGNPETYAITRGGNFDLVMRGIEMLKEMGINVHLQFVLQAANYHDLLQYKEIANKYQVSYGVQKIDFRTHMPDAYWKKAKLEDNPDIDYDLLKEYLTIIQNDPTSNLDGGARWLLARL